MERKAKAGKPFLMPIGRTSPAKLGTPCIINLYTDPREEKSTADSWMVSPMLKIAQPILRECNLRTPAALEVRTRVSCHCQ